MWLLSAEWREPWLPSRGGASPPPTAAPGAETPAGAEGHADKGHRPATASAAPAPAPAGTDSLHCSSGAEKLPGDTSS